MKHKFTHTGTIVQPNHPDRQVRLRETANFWVTEYGVKYRKTNGGRAGGNGWWKLLLDLANIKEIV